MDRLLDVTVLFALVLAFSLIIERLLEILKSLYDLFDSRKDWHRFWTRRAVSVRDRLEKKMRVFEYVDPKYAAAVLRRFSEMLLNGSGSYAGTVPMISGDLVRALAVKVTSKVVAVVLGVIAAIVFQLDLVALWGMAQHPAASAKWLERLVARTDVHLTLTGVAMGLGSGPVHKIITTIENRRKKQLKGGRS
jgi:hypothetical protein